jgi:hypothetical protein
VWSSQWNKKGKGEIEILRKTFLSSTLTQVEVVVEAGE